MLIKVIVPRFKRQRRQEIFGDLARQPLWKVAERIAVGAGYAEGTNYTFARDGKRLDPVKCFEDQVSDNDLLFLLIYD